MSSVSVREAEYVEEEVQDVEVERDARPDVFVDVVLGRQEVDVVDDVRREEGRSQDCWRTSEWASERVSE